MVKDLENIEGIKTPLSDSRVDTMLGVAYDSLSSEDNAALKEYISRLRCDRDNSRIDSLTKMKNRRSWNEDIEGELDSLGRGDSSVHSLLYFDLDHFKKVNDTYGHSAGDDVLKRVGEVVLNNIRDSDSAYRLGGEEFLVLLRDTPIAEAIKPSLKLDRAIYDEKVIVRDEEDFQTFYDTKLSGGLIEIRGGHAAVSLYVGGNVEGAMKMVVDEGDELSYHVKHNGRNNIARMCNGEVVLLKD